MADQSPADTDVADGHPDDDPTAPGGSRWGSSGTDRASVAPPSSWKRRIVVVAVLALACGILFYGTRRGQSGDDTVRDPVIKIQDPAPGTRALRQATVGAELEAGYDGRLTINGVEIPEEQMEGAVDPAKTKPKDLKRYGIRPNNRNRVFFTPGKGKVFEKLPAGEVTVTLRYFKERRSLETALVTSWTFRAD